MTRTVVLQGRIEVTFTTESFAHLEPEAQVRALHEMTDDEILDSALADEDYVGIKWEIIHDSGLVIEVEEGK